METMKKLAEWSYTPKPITRGYTKEVCVVVDLGNRDGKYQFAPKPLTDEFVDRFTGGRGFGLGLLWDAVNENTKWNDPENEVIISGGPLCGVTQYPGAGKCYSVFLSPATEQTYSSNAGGYFGPLIKFSGFDSFELRGIADRNVVIYVDGDEGKVQIFESPFDEEANSYTITEDLHDYFSEGDPDREQGKRAISGGLHGAGGEAQLHLRHEHELLRPSPQGGPTEAGGARRRRHGAAQQGRPRHRGEKA